ncbi:VOC family protein [Caldalkalibacillus salinus]|uniref:VOC family protein n=1 Tax=Caldalkalibacillus salinus TaxID=2803787 RepID=UPI001F4357B5|nr:VOC family protein [Caldalkalibacillus salinus]
MNDQQKDRIERMSFKPRGRKGIMKPIENRVDTIFVHVTNLKESVEWYSRLMGIDIGDREIRDPIFTFNMGAGRPGLTLDDHSFDQGMTLKLSNQPLFNLSTEDINAAYRHVQEMGAEIVTDIQHHPDLSDFTLKDPDGNIIMVCSCFT